jgi:predicted DNA-binding transcriptional regulator AlpA
MQMAGTVDSSVSLLETPAAAKYIDKSASWLNKARARGEGPRYVKIGGSIRYRPSDLDAYVTSCARETTDSRRVAA